MYKRNNQNKSGLVTSKGIKNDYKSIIKRTPCYNFKLVLKT